MVHLFQNRPELSKAFGTEGIDGLRHCKSFKRAANSEQFAYLGNIKTGHLNPTIGLDNDQSLGLELLERFADRHPADVEVCSNFILIELEAWRQSAVYYCAAQQFEHNILSAQMLIYNAAFGFGQDYHDEPAMMATEKLRSLIC